MEELFGGGLQAADAVHGGAVRQLQHQPGAPEWEAHPGREHRRQRWPQGRLQGVMNVCVGGLRWQIGQSRRSGDDRADRTLIPRISLFFQAVAGGHIHSSVLEKAACVGSQRSLETQQVVVPSGLVSLWLLLPMHTFFPCNVKGHELGSR